MYKDVNRGTIFNTKKKKEQNHAFIHSRLIKSAMMHPYHGILPSNQEE